VKVFLLLLLASFVVGGFNLRNGRTERFALVLGTCILVAFLLSLRRFA
jgi:hypothetical protein